MRFLRKCGFNARHLIIDNIDVSLMPIRRKGSRYVFAWDDIISYDVRCYGFRKVSHEYLIFTAPLLDLQIYWQSLHLKCEI